MAEEDPSCTMAHGYVVRPAKTMSLRSDYHPSRPFLELTFSVDRSR